MSGAYAAFRVDPTLNFDHYEPDPVGSPVVANFSRPISLHPRASRSTLSLTTSSRPSSIASSRGPTTPSHESPAQEFLAGPFIIPGNQAPQYTVEDMKYMRHSVKFPELHPPPLKQNSRPVSRGSIAPSIAPSIASTASSVTSQKRACPVHGHRPAPGQRASTLPNPPSINPHRTTPPSPLRESVKPISTEHIISQVVMPPEKPKAKSPCPIHGNRPVSSRKSTFTSSPLTIDVVLADSKRPTSVRPATAPSPSRPSTQDTIVASSLPEKAFVIPGNPLPQPPAQTTPQPSSRPTSRPQTATQSPRVNMRFSFEEDLLVAPLSPRKISPSPSVKSTTSTHKAPCPVHGLPRPPFTNRKSSLTPDASPAIAPVDKKPSPLAEAVPLLSVDEPKPSVPEKPTATPEIVIKTGVPTSFNQYKDALAQRQEEAKRSGIVDEQLPFLKQDPFMKDVDVKQRPKSAGTIEGTDLQGKRKSYAASIMSSKSTRSLRGGFGRLKRALTRKKSFVVL